MKPVEIANWCFRRGFRLEVRSERLHVIPEPEPKVVARLREVKAELLAFVQDRDRVELLAALRDDVGRASVARSGRSDAA